MFSMLRKFSYDFNFQSTVRGIQVSTIYFSIYSVNVLFKYM